MFQICKFLLILGLIVSAIPIPQNSSGVEICRASLPPKHLATMSIDNLSDLQKENLTTRTDGGLELNKQFGYLGFSDAEIATTDGSESFYPSIALDPSGKGAVVWQQNFGGKNVIYSQRIDTSGKTAGDLIDVGSNRSDQANPEIAMDSQGNFVITWQAIRNSNWNIYAKRFDRNGNQLGGELEVCTTLANQVEPAIDIDSKGNFIICWREFERMLGYFYIHAQRYDEMGCALGEEINVTTVCTTPTYPRIAIDAQGNFIIGYNGLTGSPTAGDIYARRYNSTGIVIGDEILITNANQVQYLDSMAIDSNGNTILAWVDYRNGQDYDIYAARFNSSGVKINGDISVCTAQYDQGGPSVGIDSKDNVIITWHDYRMRTTSDIYLQRYDKSWGMLGSEIKVSNGNFSGHPTLALDSNNSITLTWSDYANQYLICTKKYYHPYYSDGYLLTKPLTTPSDFYSWLNVTLNASYGSVANNRIYIDCSIDNGISWQALSASGNLSTTSQAKVLQFKLRFTTSDTTTTPILHGIRFNYISNQQPSVTLPTGFSVWRNSPVQILCNATDSDGDALSYDWSQTGGPDIPFEKLGPATITFTPNISGLYSFTVTVNDSYSSSPPASISIRVENRLPEVSVVPDKYCMKGDKVIIDAEATDPDGDELFITWTQTEGAPAYIGLEEGVRISFQAGNAGKFRFQAVANDGEADSPPVSVNLTVYGRPPFVGFSVNRSEVFSGEEVWFNAAQSYDPDGTVSKYFFNFGDGTNSSWIDRPEIGHVFSDSGKYFANVTIRDDDGNLSTSGSVSIDVRPRPIVKIKIISPANESVFWEQNVNISFSVENLTIGPGQGYVIFRVDSKPEVKWSQNSPCRITNLAEGRHMIQVSLADGSQNHYQNPEAWATIHVTIDLPKPSNTPDIIVTSADIAIKPKEPADGDKVVFSVKIRNIGLLDTGEFKIRLMMDSITIEERNITALKGSQSTLLEITWKAEVGTHRLHVFTDVGNRIREYNETNNNATVDFRVLPHRTNENSPMDVNLILGLTILISLVCITLILLVKSQKRQRK